MMMTGADGREECGVKDEPSLSSLSRALRAAAQ